MESSESEESADGQPEKVITSKRASGSSAAIWWQALFVFVLSVVCYMNAAECDLVFDDISAVRDNKDLRPASPLKNLLFNDFWGTPMSKENSHKSYRPFTVLTFRWNYAFEEANPYGYHVVNIVLHAVNSVVILKLYRLFLTSRGAFVSALLFALHPIHTEAVTGVVGRAELLSTFFSVLLFLLYAGTSLTRWRRTATLPALLGLALFSKEQGITVVAICLAYEIFCEQQMDVKECLLTLKDIFREKPKTSPAVAKTVKRMSVLFVASILLMLWRMKIMSGQLPVFTPFDNPASTSTFPARQLTYLYLLPLNVYLLLFPNALLCDYTMGTIPLVESMSDVRNVATLAFVVLTGCLLWKVVTCRNVADRCVLVMSGAWTVFPFLPASNLFFPVGFVVAERVLYMPSIGFCLLMGYGYQSVMRCVTTQKHERVARYFFNFTVLICLIAFGTRTYVRNKDWISEDTLFRAGLKVTQKNAKVFNNIGHVLEKTKSFDEALKFFTSATKVQPDDIGAWNNVGRTLSTLNRTIEAELAWRRAKDLLPQPKPGQPYRARIAPAHLNVFLNLANIMAKNATRLEEADQIYRQAISMRGDYVEAWINRGDVLLKMNRTEEALRVYQRAAEIDPTNPDIFYNMAIVYTELGQSGKALEFFNKALKIKPDHQLALLNSAVLMTEAKQPSFHNEAEQRLQSVLKSDGDANANAYFQMGLLMMDRNDPERAEEYFVRTIELRKDHKSALFNVALLRNQKDLPEEALHFLRSLLRYYPDHVKGWILVGDICINRLKDYPEAEKAYREVLAVEPENFQAFHNLCVTLIEQDKLGEADQCMLDLADLMQNDPNYLATHWRTIYDRLHKRKLAAENGAVPLFK
ncbi:hypothetical protein RvY_06038 [Ramazzottius varieornatus]|uniref:dolichyl-phosphate-mannose--protein mannosyltransferase n=1 Tax=Ramazzottius varieornatus TaxID=947166 RepID=A0A1D1UXM5_RAMVA|nr:hypothetical protein RvY_06038 [Ramazzottius varieornatus]